MNGSRQEGTKRIPGDMEVTIDKNAQKSLKEQVDGHFSDTMTTSCCSITSVLSRVSDKWTMHAIIHLGKGGTLRFTELKNRIEGISQRMLTVTLRTLEEDGFVTRRQFPQIPPRVEYTLTALGMSFLKEMISLSAWAEANTQHVNAAREAYKRRNQA